MKRPKWLSKWREEIRARKALVRARRFPTFYGYRVPRAMVEYIDRQGEVIE